MQRLKWHSKPNTHTDHTHTRTHTHIQTTHRCKHYTHTHFGVISTNCLINIHLQPPTQFNYFFAVASAGRRGEEARGQLQQGMTGVGAGGSATFSRSLAWPLPALIPLPILAELQFAASRQAVCAPTPPPPPPAATA